MARSGVSAQQVAIYLAFKNRPGKWMSNAEVAELATGIKPRTVRAQTARLVDLGILEEAAMFPGNRYRLAATRSQTAADQCRRLEHVAEVLGLLPPA